MAKKQPNQNIDSERGRRQRKRRQERTATDDEATDELHRELNRKRRNDKRRLGEFKEREARLRGECEKNGEKFYQEDDYSMQERQEADYR